MKVRYLIPANQPNICLPFLALYGLRCLCVGNPVADMDMGCDHGDEDDCQANMASTLPDPLTPLTTCKVSPDDFVRNQHVWYTHMLVSGFSFGIEKSQIKIKVSRGESIC